MGNYYNPKDRQTISDGYKNELQCGYFDDKGALKAEFIQFYSKEVAKSFSGGSLTSTQLRNFYNHVKQACSTFQLKQDKDETSLLNKIKKLDAIVKYNMSRDGSNIPEAFGIFITMNLDACNTAKDVISGFAPHFETIVGYFKYFEMKRGT